MSGGAFFEVNAGGNGVAQSGVGQLQLLDFESPASLAHKFRLIKLINDIMDVIVDIVGIMHRDEVGINEVRDKGSNSAKNGGAQADIVMVVHRQIEETATMHSEINAGVQNHRLELGLVQGNVRIVDDNDVLRVDHLIVRSVQYVGNVVGFNDAETLALTIIGEHVFDRKLFLRIKRGDFGLSKSMKPFGHVAATNDGDVGQVLGLMKDPVDVLDVIFGLGIFGFNNGIVRQHLAEAAVFVQ